MNLRAVLTVLVTGRVSHVRVVASEMPDYEKAHPSFTGGLPVGEPGRIPSWETAVWEMVHPSQVGNASC